METKTDLLADVSLQLSPSASVAELQEALGNKVGWAPAESGVRYVLVIHKLYTRRNKRHTGDALSISLKWLECSHEEMWVL